MSPAKGEVGVAPDAQVQVTFDRPMDHNSVEQHLELRPPIPGCEPSTCPPTWSGDILVLAHAGHELVPSTHYAVLLHKGYRDSRGGVNSFDHAWDFTTETAPSLNSSTPADKAVDVAVDTDIVLQFSRAMRKPAPGDVTVDPPVPLSLRLDPGDPSRLVVAPLRLLQPLTDYRLTLASSITDQHNAPIGGQRSLGFSTGRASLRRSLAFAAGGAEAGGGLRRIVELRPPPTLQSRAPTLRVLYESAQVLADFGWSASGKGLWILEGPAPGTLSTVDLAGSVPTVVAQRVAVMAPSPAHDEVAYVDSEGALHLWSGGTDVTVPAAERTLGPPAWSADGSRLAVVAAGANAPGLLVLDRATLASYRVPGAEPCAACPQPRWAFDGTTVAFAGTGPGGEGLYSYRPAVPHADAVVRLAAAMPLDFAWSADGGELYLVRAGGVETVAAHPLGGQLGVMPLIGSKPGDAELSVPNYDRRVAFVRGVASVPQLWLMNTDGSGQRQLTAPGYDAAELLVDHGAGLPRWAPAGP